MLTVNLRPLSSLNNQTHKTVLLDRKPETPDSVTLDISAPLDTPVAAISILLEHPDGSVTDLTALFTITRSNNGGYSATLAGQNLSDTAGRSFNIRIHVANKKSTLLARDLIFNQYTQAIRVDMSHETSDAAKIIIDTLLLQGVSLQHIAETVYVRGINPAMLDTLYGLNP